MWAISRANATTRASFSATKLKLFSALACRQETSQSAQASEFAFTSSEGSARAWLQIRRISQRLARCQKSKPCASTFSSRSESIGEIVNSCCMTRKSTICAERAAAPPGGIQTAQSQASTPVTSPSNDIFVKCCSSS